jgi:MFS family permease
MSLPGREARKHREVGASSSGFWTACKAAGDDQRIAVSYVGGFVARASSVGVSLFIPLFINHWFITSGRCPAGDDPKECRQAYVLASMLTGTSQLTALLLAPLFGIFTDRCGGNVALGIAAVAGVIGYLGFSRINTPESTLAFIFVALIGAGQIGAIVSSLSLLSSAVVDEGIVEDEGDRQPLLQSSPPQQKLRGRRAYKGAAAGVYSLCGGAGILLLTKLGGRMFDITPTAPFWLLAGFSAAMGLTAAGGAVLRNYV